MVPFLFYLGGVFFSLLPRDFLITLLIFNIFFILEKAIASQLNVIFDGLDGLNTRQKIAKKIEFTKHASIHLISPFDFNFRNRIKSVTLN